MTQSTSFGDTCFVGVILDSRQGKHLVRDQSLKEIQYLNLVLLSSRHKTPLVKKLYFCQTPIKERKKPYIERDNFFHFA